ncbi:NAD(P)-binding protein [Corynespora cassiicola Philippines]|uniref:NAD(P)-binding protein n=1 Tax=Corynespora cassiicola Philippines TaxID=1448308 RepID=A0A2T2N7B5_CORCC|nr:NAD(P)-binding protein [Corynespora cassiicola Philippines]
MVKVAVAGGTGNFPSALLPTVIGANHKVTIFTRGKAPDNPLPGATYRTVDYNDRTGLTEALAGFDACLSFMTPAADPDAAIERNLIHACIDAGSIKNDNGVAMFQHRRDTAAYLAEVNRDKAVLEYSLFQPSIFMDYFGHPYPLASSLNTWPWLIDFENRRAIVLEDGDQPFVLTAASDIANVLALALADDRPWPTVGGMRSCRTTYNELIALGKVLRPGDWKTDHVKRKDVENDVLTSSWVPQIAHPAISDEAKAKLSNSFALSLLVSLGRGAWDVSDEWNKRFPEYKFMSIEEYLKVWRGR